MQRTSPLKLFLLYGQKKSVFTFQEVQILSEEIRILEDSYSPQAYLMRQNLQPMISKKAKLSSNQGLHISHQLELFQ